MQSLVSRLTYSSNSGIYITRAVRFQPRKQFNFKLPETRKRNTPQWRYKETAIRQVAKYLIQAMPSIVDIGATTFITIPPSKIKTNPLYDDRALLTLAMCCQSNGNVREIFLFKADMEAFNSTESRLRPHELMANLDLAIGPDEELSCTVVLFDDVIITGCHFVACKQMLLSEFPDLNVIGVFIARRAIPNTAKLDFPDL